MLSISQLGEIRKKSIQIPQAGCEAEWESLSIYFWNLWNKKLYLWEVFYTKDVNPLLFFLIVFNKWRGTQVAIRGPPAKGLGRETGARVRIPPSPPCGCSSVGRTPDCGSGCRGFEFRQSPQNKRSTSLSVMCSVGKDITPKWRSYARVGNPDA